MDGAHGLTKDINIFTRDIQQVIHCAGKRKHLGEISPRSVIVYPQKVIIWVNEEHPKGEGQKTPGKVG